MDFKSVTCIETYVPRSTNKVIIGTYEDMMRSLNVCKDDEKTIPDTIQDEFWCEIDKDMYNFVCDLKEYYSDMGLMNNISYYDILKIFKENASISCIQNDNENEDAFSDNEFPDNYV